VTIALPFLEIMRPRAARAAEVTPKRLITFFTPNGQIPDVWVPTGSESSFTLSKCLAPLAPRKSQLLVLDGINNNASKDKTFGGHQGSHAAMLTGIGPTQTQSFDAMRPGGPSLDQVVADKIGGATKFKSLQVGALSGSDANPFATVASWRGEKELLAPQARPARVFDYLFADGQNAGASAEVLRRKRQSVLDAVADRYGALSKRLGAEDKARIDMHLASIREVEKQVLAAPTMACTVPTRPADAFDLKASNLPAYGKVQMDLLALAMACDLTRVASFLWLGMGATGVTLSFLGHTDTHHNLAHARNVARLTEINVWFAQQLLYLMNALDKYKDVGGGSLLDSTLIVWWNELGDGSVHNSDRAPFVLAGGAAGALKMGRYLSYTPRKNNNDLLLSLFNVLTGSQATTFGDPRYCTGPLTGLV